MNRPIEMVTLAGCPNPPATLRSRQSRLPPHAPALATLLVVLLLLSQVLAADGLAPPPGYKPDKKVKRLFEAKCASCHGDDGHGKTELGLEMGIADMTKRAYWKELTIESARKAVLEGLKQKVNGKDQEMKPFKDRLTPEQVDALNLYAASLQK
jgi:cytochrome c6